MTKEDEKLVAALQVLATKLVEAARLIANAIDGLADAIRGEE